MFDLQNGSEVFPINNSENFIFCVNGNVFCQDTFSCIIVDYIVNLHSKVIKGDIFYYVYGLLHSPGYRKTFANDLNKMLPRLSLVKKSVDIINSLPKLE
jgi:predicted helicase